MDWKPEGYTSVSPYIIASGVDRMMEFLRATFGAEQLRRFAHDDGRVAHAEMRIDDTVVMMAEPAADWPAMPTHLHVYVEDVDAVYARAIAAGGEAVQEPKQGSDTDRRGGVKDPSGNTWWVSTVMKTGAALALAFALGAQPSAAQSFPTDDPVIRAMWEQGMEAPSQSYRLAQVLTDSIGPRLTNTPGYNRAVDWTLATFESWGIPARREQYGTWRSWRRGKTHADLIAPRQRTLSATMLGWSPGTNGPVEGEIVVLPDAADSAAFNALLPSLRGKFVATTLAEPTCRPDDSWVELARPQTVTRMRAQRDTARREWQMRTRRAGANLHARLEAAGVAGILTNTWSAGWGADKIFTASTQRIPALHLSCEDYGLVFRLAVNNQSPRMRLDADAEFLGEQPVHNVIAEMRGTELPNEYVVLSAHLDSFDGASGATDNGTGTVMMMEAMRILKATYPNPKRTILLGLWAGEEQGLIGSGAFAADHPEIVEGLQAAFNQDNGTWRIDFIRMQGFAEAGEHFGRWFGRIPNEITENIRLDVPGVPETGGSDHMSWICRGAPGFRLQSHYPEYRQYTWHTGIDTFDKIVMDDLRNNATLAAMLAYLASEDDERVSRVQRIVPTPSGQPGNWPRCGTPRRSTTGQ